MSMVADPKRPAVRLSEMTPQQRDDAKELWLREQIGWMPEYHQKHYKFLLGRLDELRTAQAPLRAVLVRRKTYPGC